MSNHNNIANFRRKQARKIDPFALGVTYADAMAEKVRLARECAHRGGPEYVLPAPVAAALNDAHREQAQMNLDDVRTFGRTHRRVCPAPRCLPSNRPQRSSGRDCCTDR